MISRLALRDCLSFASVDLEFGPGLVVFSGPSGAGKSILMEAMLAFFGRTEARAASGELEASVPLAWDEAGLEGDDETLIRYMRKEKVRFFVNDQSVGKKGLAQLSAGQVKHLSLKDLSELSPAALIAALDRIVLRDDPSYGATLEAYRAAYEGYREAVRAYEELEARESQIESLREYARFECDKIRAVDPKIGEDDELSALKKDLSRIDRIKQAAARAESVLGIREKVEPLFELAQADMGPVLEAIDAIETALSRAYAQLETLEGIDPETILDRLEQLAGLKKRYGSIEATLEYLAAKEAELAVYENVELEKKRLTREKQRRAEETGRFAKEMHTRRAAALPALQETLGRYLAMMYLPEASLTLGTVAPRPDGSDELTLAIRGVELGKLSSGEFNRLRLAWMATRAECDGQEEGQILFLDEIDANLSGEESHSVGKVLRFLARRHQIFAISHQPQLTSLAHRHILVSKEEGASRAFPLAGEERVREIARIISGSTITDEALSYARLLLDKGEE